MKRFFRNIPWKNVLIITLVAVLGIGAIAGISSIAKQETKTISSTAFSRGALNQNGFYVESDKSIYTKNLFECQGLEIEPDFETIGNYQVFYYDAEKRFMGTTKPFSAQEDGVYVKGEDFPYAKYCRIVITPTPEKDEDGKVDEDFKINFYEVYNYANKYKISVNKDQKEVGLENFFESGIHKENFIPSYDTNTKLFEEEAMDGYNYVSIDVERISSLNVIFENAPSSLTYSFFTSNNSFVSSGNVGGDTEFIIVVPDNAKTFYLIYKSYNLPVINKAS